MTPNPTRTLVELKDLTHRYGTDSGAVPVLDSISLVIREGEWCALLGKSGSGKSTLLNLIGTLDTPSAGGIELLGRDPARMSDAERTAFRRDNLGFVYQSFNLLTNLTALENVLLPMQLSGFDPRGDVARARELLHRVGLSHRENHFPDRLSGGEQQRVAIARALVRGPRLLLADEPTGNLDTDTGARILDVLAALHADGLTIVMATHSSDALRYAQRVVRLKDGRLVSDHEHHHSPGSDPAQEARALEGSAPGTT